MAVRLVAEQVAGLAAGYPAEAGQGGERIARARPFFKIDDKPVDGAQRGQVAPAGAAPMCPENHARPEVRDSSPMARPRRGPIVGGTEGVPS
jgi:hypothetical protein